MIPHPDIEEIREALATRIDTITIIDAYPEIPDTIDPPVAVVFGPDIEFDKTFGRGSDDYTFWIVLLIARNDLKAAQKTLDSLISPFGEHSIKAKIEEDDKLGGVVDFAWACEVRDYGNQKANGVDYLGAEIKVKVTA